MTDVQGRAPDRGALAPRWRRLGLVWVAAVIPVAALAGALVDSPGGQVAVILGLGFGPFTLPGIPAGWRATAAAAPGDRPGYLLLWLGQLASVAMGAAALAGIAAGAPLVRAAAVPLAGVAGALHVAGLAAVVRRRSGQQALSVDVAETLAVLVAVVAPLAVLAWPAVVEADDAWFTLSAAVVFVFTVAGTYWVALLWARLGPGERDGLERWEAGGGVIAALVGSVTAGLLVAHGIGGFAWPAPPLVALTAVCGSMYLLIPLHAPTMWRDEFERLPPEAQARGGWVPTVVTLAGVAALVVAVAAVAGERPGALPFGVGALAVLAVLGAVRQMASLAEARRLYRQVEVASAERRLLLTELLLRSVDDRRAVVATLHRQAVSAYASFTALAATDRPAEVRAHASELVGADLRRRAESLHDLVGSMRPAGDGGRGPRLVAPIRAYAATTWGDGPRPDLAIAVADELDLDWVVEAVALQVVQEALHNVWRHAGATEVRVDVTAAGGTAVVTVTDDGAGFAPATTPEVGGLATVRAAVAVLDGTVGVRSAPGAGTTVEARLGPPVTEGGTVLTLPPASDPTR